MMTGEHAYGSTTRCDRGASLWNRTFVEGAMRARAPPVATFFFAAVVNVAYARFKADKDIMDALLHLSKETKGGGGSNRRKANPGDIAVGHVLR